MATRHPIEYAKILLSLTKGKKGKELDQAVATFAEYLKEQHVMKKAPYILKEFMRLARVEEGIVDLDITFAHEPSKAQIKEIEQQFGDNVSSTVSVDPALVGGVKIKKGNTILDGSIQTQIQKLQSALS